MKKGGIIKAKSNKIGHCEVDGRAIDIVRLNNSTKMQPLDSRGRYLHIGSWIHMDEDSKHIPINQNTKVCFPLKNICEDKWTTVNLTYKYKYYPLGIKTGLSKIGTVYIQRHIGYVPVRGCPQDNAEILIGSPDWSSWRGG